MAILKDIFLTLLFTLLVTGVSVWLLSWLPRAVFVRYSLARPLPILVLVIFSLFSLYESFCGIGAFRVNKYVAYACEQVEALAARSGELSESEMAHFVEENYPVLSSYLPTGDDDLVLTSRDYFAELRSSVRGYAWARLGWLFGFLVVAAVVLMWDATQQSKQNSAARKIYLDI